MIYWPFNLFLTLRFIIGYFFVVFIIYSFYKKAKLKFSIDYDFFQEGAHIFHMMKDAGWYNSISRVSRNIQHLNFVFKSKFSNFLGHKCWSSNHLYFKLYYPMFPMNLILSLVFVIVLSPRRRFHITPIKTSTSMLVITATLIFDYLCFKCNLFLLCGDVELNAGPKQNTAKNLQLEP